MSAISHDGETRTVVAGKTIFDYADELAVEVPTSCFRNGRCHECMVEITAARNPEWTIPALDFAGVPTGIDACQVVESGIVPTINTGVAHVGNMGSRYRMAYTAIGDSVNMASRFESLTRLFSCPIIVGEATRRAFPAAGYRELGLVEIKGKQELARVFEPFHPSLDPDSTTVGRLSRHESGLAAYYARDWDQAAEHFGALHEASPGDPLYAYYLARISEFRETPPADSWRGEVRFSVS